jgi:hypothetical protein
VVVKPCLDLYIRRLLDLCYHCLGRSRPRSRRGDTELVAKGMSRAIARISVPIITWTARPEWIAVLIVAWVEIVDSILGPPINPLLLTAGRIISGIGQFPVATHAHGSRKSVVAASDAVLRHVEIVIGAER